MTLAQERNRELAEERQRPVLAAYADDPYGWALEQAELLRSGRLDLIDATNIAAAWNATSARHQVSNPFSPK